MSFEVYSPWRLGASAYRDNPSAADLHAMPLLYVSTLSTTNNSCANGSDSCRNGTGPLGYPSGFGFSSFVESDNDAMRAVNRSLIAGDHIYYLMGDVLFRTKYTKPHEVDAFSSHDGFIGNPWEQVATLNNATATRQGLNTGIYSCMAQVSGVYKQFITCAWKDKDGIQWRGLRYCVNDGSIEKTLNHQVINIDCSISTGGIKAEILHNNKIYFIAESAYGIGVFNPAELRFDRLAWPAANIWGPHDFCTYQGRLYVMNRSSSAASGINIWEIGAEPQPRLVKQINAADAISVDTYGAEKYTGRGSLFTDRRFLYVTYQASSSTGLLPSSFAHRMLKLEGNGSGVLTYAGENDAIFYADDTVRTNVFTYQDRNPDMATMAPTGQLITINSERSGATGVHVWQTVLHGNTYYEEESVIPPVADNDAWNYYLRCTAKPHCKNGGGERVINPVNTRDYGGNQGVLPEIFGGPRVTVHSFRPGTASGCLSVDFKINNNAGDFPAGTPLAIVLKHNRDGHMPFARGSLIRPSVGSLAENNTVLRIPTSNSGVLYTVEWAYKDNGYLYSDTPTVNLFCATTGVS